MLPADTVHHSIVHVPFETNTRKGPVHPHVERVMEKEIASTGDNSPLLANIALSALDEYFIAKDDHGTPWRREVHRKRGGAFYRIV
ncbi:MAG: hypothetical protein ACRDTG_07340, partial [Pseudonocardiaceae bacterium]